MGRVFLVLEDSGIVVDKVKGKAVLLSSEHHKARLRKLGYSDAYVRPDIVFDALSMILGSPLNLDGKVTTFIRTLGGSVIRVSPTYIVPKSYDRFSDTFARLMLTGKVTSSETGDELLSVEKRPLIEMLPKTEHHYALSYTSDRVISIPDYFTKEELESDFIFHIGMFPVGKVAVKETLKYLAISEYPLSSVWTCIKVLEGFSQGGSYK